MVKRSPTAGTPCWTDLWTSDVAGSRRFYAELFAWEAMPGDERFAGYFMFARDGSPVAGAMGDLGDLPADDTWKIYLQVQDLDKTTEVALSAGASIVFARAPIDDLGVHCVLADPTGAVFGLWQPGAFGGFAALDEPGAPGWFELHTPDCTTAIDFYRRVFSWSIDTVVDDETMRYFVAALPSPGGAAMVGGIFDTAREPEPRPSAWTTYWNVEDTAASAARVTALGGRVVDGPQPTPYGDIATVADPAGATFRLRRP